MNARSPREAVPVPPAGTRMVSSLSAADAQRLGPEATDLAELIARGVPVADALIVSLGGTTEQRLTEIVAAALRDRPGVARLRLMLPSRPQAARFERKLGVLGDVHGEHDVAPRIRELFAALASPDLAVASGESLAGMHLRVVFADKERGGRAASAHPSSGDPDEIHVWVEAAAPWRVDRRTTRVTGEGDGDLSSFAVSQVADLADRAQLALGRPVDIEWCVSQERFAIVAVRSLAFVPCFMSAPYRRVALVRADEGTVAPLAIDALDKALRGEDRPSDEPRVRRIYARPYRRMDERKRKARAGDPLSIARASARAARVVSDVARPIAAATALSRVIEKRLATFDAEHLEELDDATVVDSLRDRQQLVVDALMLLDRGRVATIAVLTALEAVLGAVPRDCLPPLAYPRPVRERRRMYERLGRLARRIEAEAGTIVARDSITAALRREWDELRSELGKTRRLGIDVRPVAIGADDDAMLHALRAGLAESFESHERARRESGRRVMTLAREGPFGRTREAIVATLLLLLGQVAASKGTVCELLAAALLRLRAGACEAGRRLVDACVLDAPADALYLDLGEIEEALSGEPGAYAARVRLRREDDDRWAVYEAPRWIESRREGDALDAQEATF